MPHTHARSNTMPGGLTGLPSADKRSIAELLFRKLRSQGKHVEWLDGDIALKQLRLHLGLSKADRDENIRWISYQTELLTRNRIIVSASAISPYLKPRDAVRPRLPSFVEACVRERFVS